MGRKRLALAALAVMALGFEGCASVGGCGTGNCGGGRLANFSPTAFANRIFHCKKRGTVVAAEGCGDPALGVPVESGTLAPGVVPMAPAGGDIPLPIEGSDPQLSPATPSGTGSSTTPTSSTGVKKSYYQSPKAASRGVAAEATRTEPAARLAGTNPLADMPTFSVPAESAPTAPESTPPSPPTAGDRPTPAPEPATTKTAGASAPAGISLAAATEPAPTSTGSSVSSAPGTRRFKVVEPGIAAGSLPSDVGLSWLAETGYKTVIDLREPSEVKPSEMAAIDHVGLRYVPVSASLTTVDPARLARFDSELARADAQPIYVFDADGTRPACMMLAHLVTTKKLDRRAAERVVEDLGASDTPLHKAMVSYLNQINPPVTENETLLPPSAPPIATSAVAPVTAPAPAPSPAPAPPAPRDPLAWKPYVSLAAASLGVPLAYLGTSAISHGGRKLASLPAPARSTRSLPASSDV